jgi:predicted homoserine dehydrogenase-like protein
VATAKRDLLEGEVLDGEGGYTVYGKLMPAAASLALGGLPLGFAHHVKLRRPVASGEPVKWTDVAADESDAVVRFRRQMEAEFGPRDRAA